MNGLTIRLASVLIATLLAVEVGSAGAQAGERMLLKRERAELTAEFFTFVHGASSADDLHVNCRKRVALNMRRCRLSWETERKFSKARLELAAFRVDSERNQYRVKYRLEQTKKRCAAMTPDADCTSVERGRETYTGS